MELALIFFFTLYLLFFSAATFKLFMLFLGFFVFLFSVFLLLTTNTLLTIFSGYIISYKFEVLNLTYFLFFDGISLYFVLLTVLLYVISVLLAWNLKYKLREFLLTVLAINVLLINVFGVTDLIFFYVFFEALLMPMFLLIGIWGSRERKIVAAYQFFLYTLFGSIFMLISIFFVYSHFGVTDFRAFLLFSLTLERQLLFWAFFFFAIAVKVPMFPVHIWLPEAHVEAPTVGSVILAGVLLKLGLFALLKFLFPSFAAASSVYTPIVFLLALIGIIYASCSTLAQIDMKKLVAYSSVAHMNFAVLGMFAFNFYGLVGSIVLMLSHGLVSSGLFLCVGSLYDRYKTRLFIYYGGLTRVMPLFSFLLFTLVLSNMSFPGTFSFIGELLIFFGLVFVNLAVCILSGITMVLSAAYSLALYTHAMLGNINGFFVKFFADVSKREFFMLSVLVFLAIILGIFPNLIVLIVEGNLTLYLDTVLVFLYL
jgi:proton-translocating NADH-quinone oxidoreductase chain M